MENEKECNHIFGIGIGEDAYLSTIHNEKDKKYTDSVSTDTTMFDYCPKCGILLIGVVMPKDDK